MRPRLSVFEKLPKDFNTKLELSLESTPLSISGSPWKMSSVCLGLTGQSRVSCVLPSFSSCAPFFWVPPICLVWLHPCSLPPYTSLSVLSPISLLQARNTRVDLVSSLGLGPVGLKTNNYKHVMILFLCARTVLGTLHVFYII